MYNLYVWSNLADDFRFALEQKNASCVYNNIIESYVKFVFIDRYYT